MPVYVHVTPNIGKWNEMELSPYLDSDTEENFKLGVWKLEYPFINW